jgi:hypothetical protein
MSGDCLVFGLALIAPAGLAAADVLVQPLVLTGQAAPGTEGNFESIGPAVINDNGEIVFFGALFRGEFGNISDRVIYRRDAGGMLDLIAREGHDIGGATLNQVFDFRIDDGGRSTIRGTVGSSFALWNGLPGNMSLVAQVGGPAPEGGNFSSLGFPMAGGNGYLGFSGDTTDGATTRGNLWLYDGNGIQRQVSVGDTIPGTGSVFTHLLSPQTNAQGRTLFYGSGGGASGLFAADSGTLTVVARSGDPVPGGGVNDQFDGFANFSGNNSGQVVAQALVFDPVAQEGYDAIVAGSAGAVALVARDGGAVPGMPGVFFGFGESPTISNDGRISFHTYLSGAGVNSGNDDAIFMGPADDLRLFLREGDAAPGANAFFAGWDWPHMNGAGETILWALLSGPGVTSANNNALYFIDRESVFHLVAREGDAFEVAPGDVRTIATAGFHRQFVTHSGGDGRGISINDAGQFAMYMTFTDGSSGLFMVTVPEPTACLAAFAGATMLLRRRRGRGY